MNVNLNDWDELASYFDKQPTPPGMIYEDGKLLGFGFAKDDYADLIYLDKHGSWHCRGDWQLDAESINLMQAMTNKRRNDNSTITESSKTLDPIKARIKKHDI